MILIILVLFVSCQHLEKRGEDVTITNNMVVGVEGLIATGLIIAENMVVTVTQTLTSAEFYVDVTNDMLVTVS
jgi:hypothetical protein